MVTFNSGESDLAGFVESLQTEIVVFVEITLFERDKDHVFIKALEPLTFSWVYNHILVEFHQEKGV